MKNLLLRELSSTRISSWDPPAYNVINVVAFVGLIVLLAGILSAVQLRKHKPPLVACCSADVCAKEGHHARSN